MKLMIDGHPIEAQPGQTVLEAARAGGIEIPTLCKRVDGEPMTSCFMCAVRVEGKSTLQPSCALPAAEGMVVTAHSDELKSTRKMALELLFSDHAGCCVAPCSMTCPANVEIPYYIRAIRDGRIEEAHRIVRRNICFPATLGRICPAFCQSLCERQHVDETVSIRALHRFAADEALAGAAVALPEAKPATGKHVAIIGAGPAGLSAAYYLLLEGHACTVFDTKERPGGLVRYAVPDERLDKAVLDAEIGLIERLGMRFTPNWTLGKSGSLDELRASHDAVLLACGAAVNWTDKEKRSVDLDWVRAMGFKTNKRGLVSGRRDFTTGIDGVFAAGELTTGASNMVYAVAAGRGASVAIGQYLSSQALAGTPLAFYFWRRQLTDHEEVVRFGGERIERNPDQPEGFSAGQAAAEAIRCLECQCSKEHSCRLRTLGAEYSPSPYRFRGERRELDTDHSHGELVYEPGKCILCGNCIEVARLAGEEEGLSFVGRGLTTKVVVPLCDTLSDGIRRSAGEIIEGCPTAAFSLRNASPSALK